jgi:hypothetical protein
MRSEDAPHSKQMREIFHNSDYYADYRGLLLGGLVMRKPAPLDRPGWSRTSFEHSDKIPID